MKLFLFRHGEAGVQGASDSSRQLTAKGRRDVLDVASQFLAAGQHVDRCLVSPYRRAEQSAEIFLSVISSTLVAEKCELLRPEIRASEVIRFLNSQSPGNYLLVSHNPLLSELNALLVNGDIADMSILGTSELVGIDSEVIGPGTGSTSFHLLPDLELKSTSYS